jgi:hypothetical protein
MHDHGGPELIPYDIVGRSLRISSGERVAEGN